MISIVVEDCAYEGIKRIAKKYASDFNLVYGVNPDIRADWVSDSDKDDAVRFIFITLQNSALYEKLQNIFDIKVSGKRESYQIIKDGADIFVIGSDKRGTIYGIFDLSEQIGVTPMVYWGDALPTVKEKFNIADIEEKVSKEPSVEYRGFFINDEWPCFGNWTFSHFGGFTAEMYDHVFEFLLRMKGNCLWPAMWSSSFALDGPGQLNEELADIYGVIIDYSHHEPCLRASEEWDIYKGGDSDYGTEWNYATNKEGLHRYWRDGLIRSSKFENMITMGMRGERDSKMQGANTLEECIESWKEIIKNQDELISKYAINPDRHPKLVAIYKEVEDYFFGDDETEGLAGWEGLDDKILMFCEDNYGYMRRLPQGEMQNHSGGLGMYFHLDYHGEPVSYEWINTTPLYKIWEQMSLAYNHGIKKMWMVNVGDLKGNEYPLSYFMTMAYDFDKWGINNSNSCEEYAKKFFGDIFKNAVDIGELSELFTEAIEMISCRRPEALSKDTYTLFHGENDLMIYRCKEIISRVRQIKSRMPFQKMDAFYSLIEYPIEVGINHMLLHLYAKKNEHYAYQGKTVSNYYGDLVSQCFQKEKKLKDEFARFKDGKWKGMELAEHTGFTKWNDFGRRNPIVCRVEPLEESHMLISRIDEEFVASKRYGNPERIIIDDYNYMGTKSAAVEVAIDGRKPITCQVDCQADFIDFNWTSKEIVSQELLLISIKEEKYNTITEPVEVKITDGDATVILELHRPKDYIIIEACDGNMDVIETLTSSKKLTSYGKHGSAILLCRDSSAKYEFECRNDFDGEIEICLAPTNSHDESKQLILEADVNGIKSSVDILSEDYRAGDSNCIMWADGVLDNERRVKLYKALHKGTNTILIRAITPGLILEKIIVHEKNSGSTYTGI